VTEEWVGDRRNGLPERMNLAPDGCSCCWYISLTEPGHPVHYYDWDGWDPYQDDLQPPTQGIQHTTPTLAEWLWNWVEGRHPDWMTARRLCTDPRSAPGTHSGVPSRGHVRGGDHPQVHAVFLVFDAPMFVKRVWGLAR
jgi:hypothetical protein